MLGPLTLNTEKNMTSFSLDWRAGEFLPYDMCDFCFTNKIIHSGPVYATFQDDAWTNLVKQRLLP